MLQELHSTLRRRLTGPLSHESASEAVRRVAALEIVGSDATLVLSAVPTVRSDRLSIWDALIVEAAVRAGCDVLYSEDLNAGQVSKGVRIVDPFA